MGSASFTGNCSRTVSSVPSSNNTKHDRRRCDLGATFTGIMLLQMYALSHLDTSALFPVTTTASLIVTVAAGMVLFQEFPYGWQILGMALAVLTIFGFLYRGKGLAYSALMLWVGSAIVLVSAFNKTLLKVAADGFDIHAFQIFQYSFAVLFALLIFAATHRRDWRVHLLSEGTKTGALIGTFGILGGYALFLALQRGPFPLVMTIHSLYIFVSAIVAVYLLRERLTFRTVGLMALAILAAALMRFG